LPKRIKVLGAEVIEEYAAYAAAGRWGELRPLTPPL